MGLCVIRAPLLAAPEALKSGAIDFMHYALMCGRRLRTFNVVDDFNREALVIEIDRNIPAQRVVRVLDRIVANRIYPLKLRMDNGPELILLTLALWTEEHGVIMEFIRVPVAASTRSVPPGCALRTFSLAAELMILSTGVDAASVGAGAVSAAFYRYLFRFAKYHTALNVDYTVVP